jgi:gluconate 2-dehydrogenase gamma chain
MTFFISRRELLKKAGLASAVALVPANALTARGVAEAASAAQAAAGAAQGSALLTLTPAEAAILDAFAARLIPSDTAGVGAREAGAVRYIDRALGGPLAAARQAYAAGLAALDAHARATRGGPFVGLSPADQDGVLVELEAGKVAGLEPGSGAFFNLVRAHTIQGTFCDPFYGGNVDFAGWDLIGYPGVRTTVMPDEQRLGADVPHNHRSAYDSDMFTKDR